MTVCTPCQAIRTENRTIENMEWRMEEKNFGFKTPLAQRVMEVLYEKQLLSRQTLTRETFKKEVFSRLEKPSSAMSSSASSQKPPSPSSG